MIPAKQVWGGNPVQYIRDAHESEVFSNYAQSYEHWKLGEKHKKEFTPWNTSYLDIEATKEDVDLNPEELIFTYINYPLETEGIKYYP